VDQAISMLLILEKNSPNSSVSLW